MTGSTRYTKLIARTAFWGAIFLTFLFFILVVVGANLPVCEMSGDGYSSCYSKFTSFLSSKPNEMGDTLAGLAGTLAFIWLVASVIIQQTELSATMSELQQTTALAVQKAALREYDLALSDLYEAFCILPEGEISYGGWQFKKDINSPVEHVNILGPSHFSRENRERWAPLIHRNAVRLRDYLKCGDWLVYEFPKRDSRYDNLLTALKYMRDLVDELPKYEKNEVNGWKLDEAYEVILTIWNNSDYWNARQTY